MAQGFGPPPFLASLRASRTVAWYSLKGLGFRGLGVSQLRLDVRLSWKFYRFLHRGIIEHRVGLVSVLGCCRAIGVCMVDFCQGQCWKGLWDYRTWFGDNYLEALSLVPLIYGSGVFFFAVAPPGLFRPDVVHQPFFVIGSPGSAGPQAKKQTPGPCRSRASPQ